MNKSGQTVQINIRKALAKMAVFLNDVC